MVDFGSGQGRSVFETAGVAYATSRILKTRERRPGPKDAFDGWTLVGEQAGDLIAPFVLGGIHGGIGPFYKSRNVFGGQVLGDTDADRHKYIFSGSRSELLFFDRILDAVGDSLGFIPRFSRDILAR